MKKHIGENPGNARIGNSGKNTAYVEGILAKWTNYKNGYKDRWFVIKDGYLSYCKPKERDYMTYHKSIYLCGVFIRDSKDKTKFDLIYPKGCNNTKSISLKASSVEDCERWKNSIKEAIKATTDKVYEISSSRESLPITTITNAKDIIQEDQKESNIEIGHQGQPDDIVMKSISSPFIIHESYANLVNDLGDLVEGLQNYDFTLNNENTVDLIDPNFLVSSPVTTISSPMELGEKEFYDVEESPNMTSDPTHHGRIDVGYPMNPRDRLPMEAVADPNTVSILKLLRSAIGNDLTRISIPIQYNEPISMLQRLCEDMEYSNLLDNAVAEPSPLIRIQYITAFSVANYSSTYNRVTKPFNPLLNETFEYICPVGNYRYISEQVSHHPPITVCYAEGQEWSYWCEIKVKTKFWGRSLEIIPQGVGHIILHNTKEHYTWRKAKSTANNIILGTMWLDHYGTITVSNHTRGDACTIELKPSNHINDTRRISGYVADKTGKKIYNLFGTWVNGLSSNLISGMVDPCTDINNVTREIWKVYPRPPWSSKMYNFTSFTMALNETSFLIEQYLPPTDSRRRPDQRELENGNIDGADELKNLLEVNQRRRLMEKSTDSYYDDEASTNSVWFKKVFDNDTQSSTWVYKGGYWESRLKGAWHDSPHIFDFSMP